jgi:hypothetical protein
MREEVNAHTVETHQTGNRLLITLMPMSGQ